MPVSRKDIEGMIANKETVKLAAKQKQFNEFLPKLTAKIDQAIKQEMETLTDVVKVETCRCIGYSYGSNDWEQWTPLMDVGTWEFKELAKVYPDWNISPSEWSKKESNREDHGPETYSTVCYRGLKLSLK